MLSSYASLKLSQGKPHDGHQPLSGQAAGKALSQYDRYSGDNVMSEKVALKKRRIDPVRVKIELEATKINQNGTLLGWSVISLKGPNSTTRLTFPPKMGGGMFVAVDDEDGLVIHDEDDVRKGPTRKKFF